MRWFWGLFGWELFKYGENTLWLRGCKISAVPESLINKLCGSDNSVVFTIVLNIRDTK